MRERAVGFGHLVRVFAALDRGAYVVRGVHQLGGETVSHALAGALAGRAYNPAHSQRLAAVALDLNGDLIGSTTDAAGLHLDDRGGVAHRLVEDFDAGALGATLELFDRVVHDALGETFLAALHHLIDKSRHHQAVVACIGQKLVLLVSTSSRHFLFILRVLDPITHKYENRSRRYCYLLLGASHTASGTRFPYL